MGVNQPVGSTDPPKKKRPAWVVGGLTVVSFVALLYLVEVVNQLNGNRWDEDGIRPLEADGLWGIVWAPLLHGGPPDGGWSHLYANTVPLLVLGFLMTLAGMARFIVATAIVWIVGGFGTWLIGNVGAPDEYNGIPVDGTNHIGASGLIFGWLAYLIVFGWFTRNIWEIVIGVIVLFVYGSVLLGVLPGSYGVSWQGHLCGALAGLLAAYLLSGPERKARERRKLRKTQPPSLTTS